MPGAFFTHAVLCISFAIKDYCINDWSPNFSLKLNYFCNNTYNTHFLIDCAINDHF